MVKLWAVIVVAYRGDAAPQFAIPVVFEGDDAQHRAHMYRRANTVIPRDPRWCDVYSCAPVQERLTDLLPAVCPERLDEPFNEVTSETRLVVAQKLSRVG